MNIPQNWEFRSSIKKIYNSQNIKWQEKQPMIDIRSIYSVYIYIYTYYGSKMWSTIFFGHKNEFRCYPQQLESFRVCTMKSAYAIKINRSCHKIKRLCHSNIYIYIGTLWNFTKHLHQNPREPHKVSAPEPSGTSPRIFTYTLRNLIR